MTKPDIAPEVLAAITARVPKRLLRKLDKQPNLAADYQWSSDGRQATSDKGAIVTLLAGHITTAEQLSCDCLLAPRCLHLLAVASLLPLAPADGEQSDDSQRDAASDGATALDGAPSSASVPSGDGGVFASVVLSKQQQACADHSWRAARELLVAGASAAGAVMQAELLRCVHAARATGLHRLATAGLRTVEAIRQLRRGGAHFDRAVVGDHLGEFASVAWALQHEAKPQRIWLGIGRRRYHQLGSMRLWGVCCEPIVTRSGYAGVVTYLCDADGRLWSLADVRPGDAARACASYDAGVAVGDASVAHRMLSRGGLQLAAAAGSHDGRLGSGKGVQAVAMAAQPLANTPVAALFQVPLAQQRDRVFAALEQPEFERRAGWDLLFLRATVAGWANGALVVQVPSDDGACVLQLVSSLVHAELPHDANLRMLASATGRRVWLVARMSPRQSGTASLLAVVVPPPDSALRLADKASEMGESVVFEPSWQGRCNVGFDRLVRSCFPNSGSQPIALDIDGGAQFQPLAALRRRLWRVALGGAATLPASAAQEIERDLALLRRRAMPAAADLLSVLLARALAREQAMTGRRGALDGQGFSVAWLASYRYWLAADAALQRQRWLRAY